MEDGTESYSITGVPKMFPTVAACSKNVSSSGSIFRLSA
jgi:hypothetical protein